MADAARGELEPLVLLANPDKWFLDSLESVLAQGGYRVVTATRRPVALARARELRPDAIVLDLSLGPSDGFALCRSLRADPAISRATPIILTTLGPALRTQQLEALRAGAWELRGEPFDTEDLLLRLRAYVQGKLEVDRLATEGLIDRMSGLYNEAGVTRRSTELASLTARHGMPLSCVVFRSSDSSDRLALAFRDSARISDAVGRISPAEFAVFAPATDAQGAEGLVQRMSDAVRRAIDATLQAGIAAEERPSVSPTDLLARARAALP